MPSVARRVALILPLACAQVACSAHGGSDAGRPETGPAAWRLAVDGRVQRSLSLGLEELRAFPQVTEPLLLVCPGSYEVRHTWSGAPLAAVLAKAGPMPGAARVRLLGADGYAQELPLEQAVAEGVLLAYEVDGHALGEGEGAPLRLAARNQPGFAWVQRLVRIEVR